MKKRTQCCTKCNLTFFVPFGQKTFLSIFLALTLAFAMLPAISAPAAAADGPTQVTLTQSGTNTGDYNYDKDTIVFIEGAVTITGDSTYPGMGISAGTLTLVLTEGSKLTLNSGGNDYAGLYVADGAFLNIIAPGDGSGTLTANGGNAGAGIGGQGAKGGKDSGTINIYGGTITATGTGGNAGIGGNGSTVTIFGGNIKAESTGYGAGIGGGGNGEGTITIYGGDIEAKGGGDFGGGGAGIGGGGYGGGPGIVTIYGGTITATGGAGYDGGGGAGIGGGGGAGDGKPGTVYIYDGTITAIGGAGGVRLESETSYGGGGGAGIGGGGGGYNGGAHAGGAGTVSFVDVVIDLDKISGGAGGDVTDSNDGNPGEDIGGGGGSFGGGAACPNAGDTDLTAPGTRTVTVEASPAEGGIVAPTGTFKLPEGEAIPFNLCALPEAGYVFVNWTITPDTSLIGSYNDPFETLMIPAADAGNIAITANFYKHPVVVSITPIGTTDVPINGSFDITFDMAMDPRSPGTLNNLGLFGMGSWSSDNKTYTLPYSALSYSAHHTFVFDGFKDGVYGLTMVPFTHTFTTVAAPPPRPAPTVTEREDPPVPATKLDNGVEVDYTLDAAGLVTLRPTDAQIAKLLEKIDEHGTLTFAVSGIEGLTAAILEIDLTKLLVSDKLQVFRFEVADLQLSFPVKALESMRKLAKTLRFGLKPGSIIFELTDASGARLDWQDTQNQVTVSLPFRLPHGILERQIVMVREDGTAIPRSWYAEGRVYARVRARGHFDTAMRENIPFEDTAGQWMEEAVSYMAAREVVLGVGDNRFDHGGTITYAHFATMLSRALGGELDYQGAVAQFGTEPIPRQEMFLMAFAAMEQCEMLPKTIPGQASLFDDWGQVDVRCAGAIQALTALGLVSGNGNGLLNPLGSSTRAEGAQFLYNILIFDAMR